MWPSTSSPASTECASPAAPTSTRTAMARPPCTPRPTACGPSTTSSTSPSPGRRSRSKACAGDLPRAPGAQRGARRDVAPAPRRRHRHAAADAHFRHHHDIELVAGSKASIAMGTVVAHSHCVHHQAVDTLGAGLVVTAWCDDVIEGIELPDRWVVGVQWHPEDDADDEPAQQALFDAFVTASREQSPGPRPVTRVLGGDVAAIPRTVVAPDCERGGLSSGSGRTCRGRWARRRGSRPARR